MEILNYILPFSVSLITLIVGWMGGRRKSAAEVEIIKSDHAEKLLQLNDQYLIEFEEKRYTEKDIKKDDYMKTKQLVLKREN